VLWLLLLLNRTVVLHGSTIVVVRCRFCLEKYRYLLERRGQGQGYSDGAARDQARDRLNRALDTGIDPVPCPHCGRYQDNMVELLRKRRHAALRFFGSASLVVGVLAGALIGLVVLAAADSPRGVDVPAAVIAFSLAAVPLNLGIVLLWVRRFKAAAYDPNKEIPREERLRLADRLTLSKREAEDLLDDDRPRVRSRSRWY
jgi:hypothetical protein